MGLSCRTGLEAHIWMMLLRIALLLSILVACAGSCGGGAGAAPGPATPGAGPPATSVVKATPEELERIDVFGSKRLGRDAVLARWGDRLAQYVRDPKQRGGKAELEAEIQAAGKLAFVDLSTITYFSPRATYLTVDLVDEEDRAERMTFDPAPTGTHADPDGLLALWNEYERKAMGMMMDGTLKATAEACPFWHCISFGHEALIPYRDAFGKRVPPVERELVAVLREEKRDHERGAAAYLLAHLASGPRVVELMLPSMSDPSQHVRNNAMRVLALIASNHPEVAIPIGPVLAALRYPSTTDRNKASAILEGITSRGVSAELRAQILASVGELLVDMLALRQPNNHDFAYKILKHLSGRDLGERNIEAWRAWVRSPR
jgi:hypothetical protein